MQCTLQPQLILLWLEGLVLRPLLLHTASDQNWRWEQPGNEAKSLLYWAIPFNKRTPPMDDFSLSVPGGINTLGYFRITL